MESEPDIGSAVEWYKRVGTEFADRLDVYNKERCVNCFRPQQLDDGSTHVCDNRLQKLTEVLLASIETSTPELRTTERLWALSKVTDGLLTKYLSKLAQHRRNAGKAASKKSKA